MFYSHEVLTNRKYGVATIWLVATLGSKSTARKVTKKAILDVNLKKACETIMEPEAPLALRLQSNLLFGVTRVYYQQYDYLLHDAQQAQTSIRTFLKGSRTNQLDMTAQKARPEQLMLQDDPAFMIDDIIPPPLEPDFVLQDNSQRSSQSMLSVRGRSGSTSSDKSGHAVAINLPSSSHGGGSYHLPDNAFGSSVPRDFGEPDIFNDDEQMFLNDDDLFDFDADGNLRDISASEREARRAGSGIAKGHFGSDPAASKGIHQEHQDRLTGRQLSTFDADGDYNMIIYDEDMQLPDAEAFPAAASAAHGGARLNDQDFEDSQESSSISAEAPLQRDRPRARLRKRLNMDDITELHNNDLTNMQTNYLANMKVASRSRIKHRASVHAKKNAFHFVFATGINGVGEGVGASRLSHPLRMFSGEALYRNLRGEGADDPLRTKRGNRCIHDAVASSSHANEESSPSKRARESEIGRGDDMGGDGMMLDLEDEQRLPDLNADQSLELGRDAPSALQDYPSSAQMPWNVSASAHSHQRGRSSSIKGRASIVGSRRLTSASPLVGRGSVLPLDLASTPHAIDDEMVLYGRSDNEDFATGGDAADHSSSHDNNPFGARVPPSASQHEDFELFGPAAGVDTQTAATSQWIRDALDRESNNFFEFVRNTIAEKGEDELGDEVPNESRGVVTFEELFDPGMNSAVVAAQAFYHVLSLATKGRVWVEQSIAAAAAAAASGNSHAVEEEGEDYVLDREIRIGIVEEVVF